MKINFRLGKISAGIIITVFAIYFALSFLGSFFMCGLGGGDVGGCSLDMFLNDYGGWQVLIVATILLLFHKKILKTRQDKQSSQEKISAKKIIIIFIVVISLVLIFWSNKNYTDNQECLSNCSIEGFIWTYKKTSETDKKTFETWSQCVDYCRSIK